MSEHLIINDTFGKSKKVLEKMAGQALGEIESVENLMLSHTPTEIADIVREVNHVEIKGVENYAQQFQEFVKGFPGCEAPFIFAGLKIFLDIALASAPFNIDEIKEKYEAVLKVVEMRTLRVNIVNKTRREGDE